MTLIGNVKHIEQGRRARERVFFVIYDDLICTLQGQHVALMLLNTSSPFTNYPLQDKKSPAGTDWSGLSPRGSFERIVFTNNHASVSV